MCTALTPRQIAAILSAWLSTQDIRFRVMAEEWQRRGKPFAGLLYGHQLAASIGRWVADLELIAKASECSEWKNNVQHLPL